MSECSTASAFPADLGRVPEMCKRYVVAAAFLLCVCASPMSGAAQPLDQPIPPNVYDTCGSEPSRPLTYRTLGELLAPVLWFSPDEPLLRRRSLRYSASGEDSNFAEHAEYAPIPSPDYSWRP